MNQTYATFAVTVDGMRMLAAFLAELHRQGCAYTVRQDDHSVEVTVYWY